MKKRILSLFLAFCITLAMLPAFAMTASAATETTILCFNPSAGTFYKGTLSSVSSTYTTAPTNSGSVTIPGATWNSGTKTLTLDNVEWTTSERFALYISNSSYGAIILNLVGTSSFVSTYSNTANTSVYYTAGVCSVAGLTITGSGSLNAEGGNNSLTNLSSSQPSRSSGMVNWNGTLTIAGGTITATGNTGWISTGIFGGIGTTVITGGDITATANAGVSESNGISSDAGITVNGGKLNLTAKGSAITSNGFFCYSTPANTSKIILNAGVFVARGNTQAIGLANGAALSFNMSNYSWWYDSTFVATIPTKSAAAFINSAAYKYLRFDVPTAQSSPPDLSAGSGTADRMGDDANISFDSDKPGTIYYIVKDSGDPAPTKPNNDGEGWNNAGSALAGENDVTIPLEDSGAKDIYIVVADDDYNVSDVLKFSVGAATAGISVTLNTPKAADSPVTKYSFINADVSDNDSITSITFAATKSTTIASVPGTPAASSKLESIDGTTRVYTYVFNTGIISAQAQAFIRGVVFNYVAGAEIAVTVDANKTVLPTGAKITKFAHSDGKDHYYMYVGLTKPLWADSYNSAKSYMYMGMVGYLATITSAQEDALLTNISTTGAWTGGTRLRTSASALINDEKIYTLDRTKNVNFFYWACGPETGTIYYNSTTSGSSGYNGAYINWQSGEPNNYSGVSGEECMQVNYPKWNDQNANNTNSNVSGYFVEFSNYTGGMDAAYASDKTAVNLYNLDSGITAFTKTDPTVTWPTGLTETYGQTLATITLPGNGTGTPAGTFTWTAATTTSVGNAGQQTFNMTFTPTDKANYNTVTQNVTITVNKKPITISGITAANKVYDGNTAATLNMPAITTAMGLVSGDTLTVTAATGTFNNKSVANGKTVTISGLALGGTSVGNYQLAGTGQQASTTANITAKAITMNVTVNDKAYDGLNTATIASASLNNVIDGDTVSLGTYPTATFASVNVANGITINLGSSFILTGTDATNYTLTQPTGIKANITNGPQSTLAITGGDITKTYGDSAFTISTIGGNGTGNVSYTITGGNDVISISGNTVTILKAGTATVTATKAGDNNYNAITSAEITITVNKKTITISGITAASKVYDGNTAATLIMPTITTAMGLVSGDTLTVTATGTFDNKNVGTGKTVNISALTLGGASVGNYHLAGTGQQTNTTANITAKSITMNVAVNNKPYDGKNTASISSASLNNVVSGDIVSIVTPYPTAAFASINAANGIAISFSGKFTLTGTDAGNYTLTQPTGITANITNGFTPVKPTHYSVTTPDGSNGWFKLGNFIITTTAGYTVSLTNTDGGTWNNALTYSADIASGSVTFYVRNTATGEISAAVTETYKIDKTAPDTPVITIEKINTSNFARFINFITFGAFFKEGFKVTITATDALSSVTSITYNKGDGDVPVDTITGSITFNITTNFKGIISAFATDKAGNNSLSATSVGVVNESTSSTITVTNESDFTPWLKADKNMSVTVEDTDSGINKIEYSINGGSAAAEFTAVAGEEITTTKSFTIPVTTEGSYNVVISVEDNSGNTSTKTVAVKLDTTAPAISGITNGSTYCASQTVSVSDTNIDTVTVNGIAVTLTDGKFILSHVSGTQAVVVTDKAGNCTTVTVTVNNGHSYGSWTQTIAPTCTEKGSEKHICTVCQHEESRDINALGHDWESEFTTDTTATCTAAGSKSHHCSRCTKKTDVTEIPATGHNYGSWSVSKMPTTKNEGERKKVCSVCGDVVTEKINKLITNVIGKEGGDPALDAQADLSGAVDITGELEKGNRADIYLEVTDISGTVSAEDKAKITADLQGKEIIAMYLDISLFIILTKPDGNSEKMQHREASKLIAITVTVPKELWDMAPYTIIRTHDGVITRLETVYDEVNHTLTFQTDKFSTYAILVTEKETSNDSTPDSTPTIPKTGDDFNQINLWLWLAASAALTVVCVKRRRCKI